MSWRKPTRDRLDGRVNLAVASGSPGGSPAGGRLPSGPRDAPGESMAGATTGSQPPSSPQAQPSATDLSHEDAYRRTPSRSRPPDAETRPVVVCPRPRPIEPPMSHETTVARRQVEIT